MVSYKNKYIKPKLNTDGIINITDGRHPVVERIIGDDKFIPNNTNIDIGNSRLSLITGPNMAGKSTYIRQVAIIMLMSQIGCFIPSSSANICVVDRIFTRVGASDDLTSGQSTFMVEMNEVSNILKFATKDSLVILDEVGRGTGTIDGLSIAWATAEHLLDEVGCKTLFATHYHELTELANTHKGVVNSSISVKNTDRGIVFLHKINVGISDKSYGIEVAKLAGLPNVVITRAENIMNTLERATQNNKKVKKYSPKVEEQTVNLLNYKYIDTANKIKELSMEEMSPIEIFNYVYKLQKELSE